MAGDLDAGPIEVQRTRHGGARLLWLLIANVAATILHYVDNILFFSAYPEPQWATPHLVDAFWFVMTPFGVAGYVLCRRGLLHWGGAALYLYSGMSLLVLGHYLYAPLSSIAARIHLFIVLEAVLAVILIGYVMFLQVREWHRERHAEAA